MNTKLKIFSILSVAILLSACASYQPVIDMQGVDPIKYEADLAECHRYADQIDAVKDGATGTLVGAGIGAAFGAAIGAVVGAPASGAAMGATAGGFGGGASETNKAMNRKKDIMDNCLRNRGYKILG